eukprot:Clim_evm41s119 gene=Clim_evmTU41s119
MGALERRRSSAILQNDNRDSRVLSIQSHVVSGYVGNRSATFPLQLLGFEVDVINSVQFSNHTGYIKGIKGERLSGEQLDALYEGMCDNGLQNGIAHLLTGYVGNASFLRQIVSLVNAIREVRAKLNQPFRYVCDPVMGDDGEFYTPPDLVEIYRDEVLPVADEVTPNQFELEHISGITVRTLADLTKAIDFIHDKGPSLVVITSSQLEDDPSSNGKVSIYASEKLEDGTKKMWRLQITALPGSFTGTGDLFAAMLLAQTTKYPSDTPLALKHVAAIMAGVLKATHERYVTMTGDPECREQRKNCMARELRLIGNNDLIEAPDLSTVECEEI